jgi:hypothetical protein
MAIVLGQPKNFGFQDWSVLKDCSTSVKFSLITAVLGVYKVEDLVQAKCDDRHFMTASFQFLATESEK